MQEVQSVQGIQVDYEQMRPGQRKALDVILRRWTLGHQYTSIVLPTRYGKSDVIRLSSLLGQSQRLVGSSLVLVPAIPLRKQMVKTDHLDRMAQRYNLDVILARKCRAMIVSEEWEPFANGEYLLSATMQLATTNVRRFAQLASTVKETTGLPLAVHMDECHEVSTEQKRGELAKALTEAGCFLVLHTATPIRSDGELIPGFEIELVDTRDRNYEVPHLVEHEGRPQIKHSVYDGYSEKFRLVAHHETTFKEAWSERPSPLTKLDREVVDTKLTDNRNLSELSSSESREYLAKCIRDESTIRTAVRMFLQELAIKKHINPKCAGIIFTGNDRSSDAEDNRNAKLVKSSIIAEQKLHGLDLAIEIITMKTEEGEEDTAARIEAFVGRDFDNGKGDVLIVKQIGGAGLDCPRLKVLLDLSSVRTVASVIQRLTRVGTPYQGITCAKVITLDDERMRQIWQERVVEAGGEWMQDRTTAELVDIYYTDPEEEKDRAELDESFFSGYDDNMGNLGDMTLHEDIQALFRAFPILDGTYTKAEAAEKLSGIPASIKLKLREKSDNSIEAQLQRIYDKLKTLAKEKAGIYPGGNSEEIERWRKRVRENWIFAKKTAGVPKGTDLQAIKSLETLSNMEIALRSLPEFALKK